MRLLYRLHQAWLRCSLCLAYHAAKLAAPDKAEQFLINLRAATVLQCRPTTHRELILEIVNETGIDEDNFTDHFLNGSADAALAEDQRFAQHLGIHGLPAYLLSYGGRGWILPFKEDAGEFTLMTDRFVNESTKHDSYFSFHPGCCDDKKQNPNEPA